MLDKVKSETRIEEITKQFNSVRKLTERLCQELEIEDYNLQAMAETSPVKWHLAHTSWFFETFILKCFEPDFVPYHPEFEYLFNSYYNSVGEQFLRPNRHLLSRPTVTEVFQYRENVANRMMALLESKASGRLLEILPLVVLGVHHEQQHQELLLTDLKYNFYQNPLLPRYSHKHVHNKSCHSKVVAHKWLEYQPELCVIGIKLGDGVKDEFCFDNESPQHQHYLQGFAVSNRLVTNAEYLEFIEQGGYEQAELWLSDGWAVKCQEKWNAPLYWFKRDGAWHYYTLHGPQPLALNEPVTHVSYYEADAFATWKGARLPTEQEWERVASSQSLKGPFLESSNLTPSAQTQSSDEVMQLYGQVWQWTSSSYSPYPGYQPLAGGVGEYNGKFMANQYVLRGGSCVSSQEHIRASYRNFFYPDARWQFSGIRLAKDL